MGKINNITKEQMIKDHVLFREWYDNLPYSGATKMKRALREFCGVGQRTVDAWLEGTRPIRIGYKRLINIFTNQQIFDI